MLLCQLILAFRRPLPAKSSQTCVLYSQPSDYSGYALLFDCDGVIVETEVNYSHFSLVKQQIVPPCNTKELHRIAYNKAFKKFGLILPNGQPVEWDPSYCTLFADF